jgi:outer membrane protein
MIGDSRNRVMRGVATLAFLSALTFAMPQAHAESFKTALQRAYQSNPTLQGERARQRQTDEFVPQAKSGWRPQINAQGTISKNWSDNNLQPHTTTEPKTLSIQLSQPIFRGFKTVEGTKQARETVKAGRQALVGVEQNVLLNALTAYLNVYRDRQVLALRERNVTNLQRQANAAAARFEAGEVTRTDVSQARARVSGAKAQVAVARANLGESSARYRGVIGSKPGKLSGVPVARNPRRLDDALAIARQTNPNILSATHAQLAQQHAIEVTKGDLLPEVSLQASAQVTYDPNAFIDRQSSVSVQGVVNIPIYEGGRVYSAVRQAKQLESQRRIEIIGATRGVTQSVTSSWNYVLASREAISAAKAQVSASSQALEGVRQEYLVGSRSTVDVLNAEQEVVNARISLVSAEHDYIVSSYQLQAAIGKLTARHLSLGGPYYDVEENFDRVKNKWIGTGVETVE